MKLQSLNTYRVVVFAIASMAALALVVAFALFAHAEVGPTVNVAILNSSGVSITTAPIGSVVHANTSIASTTGPAATGTVDFSLYSNTSCSGSPSVQAGVALASTTTASSTANSATTVVGSTGLSYKVHYSGEQGVYPANDSSCVVLTATATPTISTTLSSSTVAAGSSVHDSAALLNMTSNATGTVAYTVYTNTACTLGAQSAGTKSVTNGVVPNSDAVLFNTPGTYYWQAAYSGDQFNGAALSSCQSEVLTVNATTSTPTTGTISVDEVTTPANDSQSFHFTTTGSGYPGFDLADASGVNSQVLSPGTYTISQNSVSNWNLTSATCSTNNAAAVNYSQGSNLTLNAGDTIRCVFKDTKISTSTNPGQHCNGDNDADDTDCDNATSTNNGHHGFGGFLHDCADGIRGVAVSLAHKITNTEKQITKTQTRLDTLHTKLDDLKSQQAAGVTDEQAIVHAPLNVSVDFNVHHADKGKHKGHDNNGDDNSNDD